MTVQIENIGGKTAIVLSPELLEKLNAREGDTVEVADTPRGVELAVRSSNASLQMRLAERIMREDKDVLRRLAGK